MNTRWPDGYKLDGKYKIIRRLALTERCEIYLAEEIQALHHTIVIKRLKPDRLRDLDAHERFVREAEVLRRIHHQTILPIYDVKLEDDECYFVTAYATQGSLQDYLLSQSERRLEPLEALDIAMDMCEGLSVAHKQSIVHRDIKPGNILLFRNPDHSLSAMLADFSIASIISDKTLTVKDTQLCTPLYAAPEQLTGELVDSRSDLYSWGTTFFEMLSGESPDKSLKPPTNAVFFPSATEFPLDFFTVRGVPVPLASVLNRSLRMDRTRRYQSATEILEDLTRIKAVLTQPDAAPTDTTLIRVDPNLLPKETTDAERKTSATLRERLGNRRAVVAISLSLLAMLGLGLGWGRDQWCQQWPGFLGCVPTVSSQTLTPIPTSRATVVVNVVNSPTPTPTPSATPAPPSLTPTPTLPPTPTELPTLTPTPTRRPSTATPTVTPTDTPTSTPTPALVPVVLDQPTNNQALQSDIVTFEWFPISASGLPSSYNYQVLVRNRNETEWKTIVCTVPNIFLIKFKCEFRAPQEGEYFWKAALYDDKGLQVSRDSVVRQFTVKRELPTPEPPATPIPKPTP